VRTLVGAEGTITVGDLPVKSHERLFFERVPLPWDARAEVALSDPWRYAELAEGVEAWGFRMMQGRGEMMPRDEVAQLWLEDEFRPVVAMLREAGLADAGTAADAYMHVISERYRLMRTHEWNDDVLERLRSELR
jgi:hypothetical protein